MTIGNYEGDPEKANERQGDQSWRARAAKRLQGWSPFLEIAVTASTVVGLIFLTVQSCFMMESNELTRESNQLTREALADSRRQFDLSRQDAAADAAEGQRRFEISLEESRKATEKQQSLSASSLQLARESIVVARQELVESLSAKISVIHVSIDFEDSERLAKVELFNGGASAAEQISTSATWVWGGIDAPTTGVAGRIAAAKMQRFANDLAPDGRAALRTPLPSEIDSEKLQAIKDGTARLFLWVRYRYTDRVRSGVFSRGHSCFRFNSKRSLMEYCEADGEPVPSFLSEVESQR